MHGFKKVFALFLIATLLFSCAGCTDGMKAGASVPEIPKDIQRDDGGVPVIRLYDEDNEKIEEIDIETYIMGVVAGEMRSDWPLEALKAQAILARTFTMKFLSSKDSKYAGADISTDIHEAQAYDAMAVNDRIRQAVQKTAGMVMVADGEYPHAWFHAHSGGTTELPTKALEYKEDPAYLSAAEVPEPEDAPENVKNWTAEFSFDEIAAACKASGQPVEEIKSFELGEKGESGRTVNFIVNGKTVSAPSFRLNIGSSKLKSTLIDSIAISGDKIYFTGRGFGHGVGMSQWGAYGLAKEGKDYRDIISQYFTGVDLVRLWK